MGFTIYFASKRARSSNTGIRGVRCQLRPRAGSESSSSIRERRFEESASGAGALPVKVGKRLALGRTDGRGALRPLEVLELALVGPVGRQQLDVAAQVGK